MARYKRNQLEEAIVRTLGARDAQIPDLKMEIKRLLLTDRRLGRGKRSDRGVYRYAFYSAKPKGTGIEVLFTDYEVFAVMAAIILLQHGIPQAKVVSILQQVRSDFEAAHRETLRMDRKELFDAQAVRAMARPGMLAADNTAPVYLAFVKMDAGKGTVRATVSVCRGWNELVKFVRQYSVLPGAGATHFEFVRLMHKLATHLSETRPVKRGRSTI
jgi:predicted methyltransferase MtxX (methanogen marker protein 4)